MTELLIVRVTMDSRPGLRVQVEMDQGTSVKLTGHVLGRAMKVLEELVRELPDKYREAGQQGAAVEFIDAFVKASDPANAMKCIEGRTMIITPKADE